MDWCYDGFVLVTVIVSAGIVFCVRGGELSVSDAHMFSAFDVSEAEARRNGYYYH